MLLLRASILLARRKGLYNVLSGRGVQSDAVISVILSVSKI
jgi:hypothetical protein